MLPQWTVVGFSGHRSLADPGSVATHVGALLDGLAAAQGSLAALASLAKGADAIFAAEAVKRNIPLLLVLPFPVARFQQDFQPHEWLAVAPLLAKAAHIEVVSGSESDDEAYMETGVRIVDDADVVVAVWDGKPTAGLGGTGDVVRYARAMDKPIQWFDPGSGQVVTERWERLPASEASTAGAGEPDRTPGGPASLLETVERNFVELDAAASERAPNVRHLIQRIVLLHLVASLFALIALALQTHGLIAYGVALLPVVLLVLAFALTAMRQHRHAEWMRTRLEAEVCRSFLATWPMRTRLNRPPQLSMTGFEGFTRRLRLMQLLDRTPSPSLEAACAMYLRDRVEDQIEYFSRRSDVSRRAYRGLRDAAMTSTALATTFAAGHLVLLFAQVEGPVLTVAVSMSLVLPLVSAALLSLVLTHEHARRAARYREMVVLLERAGQQLKAVRTWQGLTRIAVETEEALLAEAVEWHTFRRFASEPH